MDIDILSIKAATYSQLGKWIEEALDNNDMPFLYAVGKEMRERIDRLKLPASKQTLPQTDLEITDDTPMPFGKHKGKPMGEVPTNYLDWLARQDDFADNRPEMFAYIQKRKDSKENEFNWDEDE